MDQGRRPYRTPKAKSHRLPRPKQIDGGDRKKERKALGYALFNTPRTQILAVAKERKELREIVKLTPIFEELEGNVEVALWPLGVEMPPGELEKPHG